jgi:chromosome segregation ATPase
MKNFRQSLLTLTLLSTAIMTSSFRIQDGIPFLTSQEIERGTQNYRSIATLKGEQQDPIIAQINVRITEVINVRQVITHDRELLATLQTQAEELKNLIAINETDKNKIQDLKVKAAELQSEIEKVTMKLKNNIASLEEEKVAIEADLEAAQSSNASLQEHIEKLKIEFDSQATLTQNEIDNAHTVIEGLNNDLSTSQEDLAAKEEAFQKLEQENCLKEQKITKLQDDISVAIKDKEEVMTALAELEEELASLENDEDDADSNDEDDSDEDDRVADTSTATNSNVDMQSLMTMFSGVMSSQMQLIQQMQAQNQQFMMSQMLSTMGPVDTGSSSLERYLMYRQPAGINHFGIGGYSSPMSTSLAPEYSDFVSMPQYSAFPSSQFAPTVFQRGIPTNLSFGGGRAPAIMGPAPMF